MKFCSCLVFPECYKLLIGCVMRMRIFLLVFCLFCSVQANEANGLTPLKRSAEDIESYTHRCVSHLPPLWTPTEHIGIHQADKDAQGIFLTASHQMLECWRTTWKAQGNLYLYEFDADNFLQHVLDVVNPDTDTSIYIPPVRAMMQAEVKKPHSFVLYHALSPRQWFCFRVFSYVRHRLEGTPFQTDVFRGFDAFFRTIPNVKRMQHIMANDLMLNGSPDFDPQFGLFGMSVNLSLFSGLGHTEESSLHRFLGVGLDNQDHAEDILGAFFEALLPGQQVHKKLLAEFDRSVNFTSVMMQLFVKPEATNDLLYISHAVGNPLSDEKGLVTDAWSVLASVQKGDYPELKIGPHGSAITPWLIQGRMRAKVTDPGAVQVKEYTSNGQPFDNVDELIASIIDPQLKAMIPQVILNPNLYIPSLPIQTQARYELGITPEELLPEMPVTMQEKMLQLARKLIEELGSDPDKSIDLGKAGGVDSDLDEIRRHLGVSFDSPSSKLLSALKACERLLSSDFYIPETYYILPVLMHTKWDPETLMDITLSLATDDMNVREIDMLLSTISRMEFEEDESEERKFSAQELISFVEQHFKGRVEGKYLYGIISLLGEMSPKDWEITLCRFDSFAGSGKLPGDIPEVLKRMGNMCPNDANKLINDVHLLMEGFEDVGNIVDTARHLLWIENNERSEYIQVLRDLYTDSDGNAVAQMELGALQALMKYSLMDAKKGVQKVRPLLTGEFQPSSISILIYELFPHASHARFDDSIKALKKLFYGREFQIDGFEDLVQGFLEMPCEELHSFVDQVLPCIENINEYYIAVRVVKELLLTDPNRRQFIVDFIINHDLPNVYDIMCVLKEVKPQEEKMFIELVEDFMRDVCKNLLNSYSAYNLLETVRSRLEIAS